VNPVLMIWTAYFKEKANAIVTRMTGAITHE
jgi:hypothetical protein